MAADDERSQQLLDRLRTAGRPVTRSAGRVLRVGRIVAAVAAVGILVWVIMAMLSFWR